MSNNTNTAVHEAVEAVMSIFKTHNFAADIALTTIRRSKAETPIPSDKWSLMNRLIMLFSGTHDARGYQQWKEVNRFVQKGSKAIRIVAPVTHKIKAEDSKDGKEKIIITGFRHINVFAIESTSGEPLTVVDYTPDADKLPPYLDVAEALAIKVKWKPVCRAAYGWFSPASKEITMCSEDWVNYFHELGHAVANIIQPLSDFDDAFNECVAEMTAAVLCELNHIQGYHHQSYEYIKEYTVDKSDKAVLSGVSSVLNMVEKVVILIIDTAKTLEENRKEERANA